MIYEIKQVKNVDFSAIVYAISYENPLQDIDSISHELSSMFCSSCNVLFDLLLSNGDEFNRFVMGRFEENKINYDSLRIITIEDSNLKKQINSYYRGKYSYLKNSVLSLRQMTLFSK
ncbi:MAG: type II toxin-antitoxin system RnlB family antitoxin [Oscillospiraceae bacterium]|nr:type II toxin-antitoxin system RnlB family antitoxin [Oscillospiraceae bacterium]